VKSKLKTTEIVSREKKEINKIKNEMRSRKVVSTKFVRENKFRNMY